MNNQPYRQGDVLIQPVDSVPSDAIAVARDNGRSILAYGEVTGHAHALHGPGARVLARPNGERFLLVDKEAVSHLSPRKAEVALDDDRFTRIMDASGLTFKFANDDDRLALVLEKLGKTLTLPGEIVQHEEHDAVVLPPRSYKLPGQREYVAPEITRAVAD